MQRIGLARLGCTLVSMHWRWGKSWPTKAPRVVAVVYPSVISGMFIVESVRSCVARLVFFSISQAADGQCGGNAETRLQYLMQQSEVFTHFLDRCVCGMRVRVVVVNFSIQRGNQHPGHSLVRLQFHGGFVNGKDECVFCSTCIVSEYRVAYGGCVICSDAVHAGSWFQRSGKFLRALPSGAKPRAGEYPH